MTTKIKATNIWKKFNNLEVLKGIDLEVNEGEVVAVIGPSGGGKSTLLRCLNKLETIDKGSIIIDGEELCRETAGGTEYVNKNDIRRIACKMGMVFQQFNLFPHMTVLENLIEAPVNVQKRDKAEVIKEAEVPQKTNWIFYTKSSTFLLTEWCKYDIIITEARQMIHRKRKSRV